MEKIIFLPVVNYNGYYQISQTGLVRSLDRVIELESGDSRRVKGQVLKPKDNGSGYLFVSLCISGMRKNEYIHRLVAGAFIDNPDDKPFVNHKDGNPGNNHVSNLEWVSHRENVKHAYDLGLNSNCGGHHFMACGVIDNELGKEFKTIKEWTEARKINYATGRNLVNGYSSLKDIDPSFIKIIKKNDKNEE